jgi:hypothetical protein
LPLGAAVGRSASLEAIGKSSDHAPGRWRGAGARFAQLTAPRGERLPAILSIHVSVIHVLCFLLSGLAALAGVVGLVCAATAKGLGADVVRVGLAAAIAGALPGLIFVANLVRARGGPVHPYDVAGIGPALLWILAGPIAFLVSAGAARPGRVPLHVDALRAALFLGWIAASFIAVSAALLV